MTKREMLAFIRGNMKSITESLCAYIEEHQPECWDGHELRILIRDFAEENAQMSHLHSWGKCLGSYNAARARAYKRFRRAHLRSQ